MQEMKGIAAALASLASLAAALTCCLPLGTLLLSAGSAGASLFAERLRPWLLAFSLASLLFAFVQTYVRGRCEFRRRKLRTVLFWFSAFVFTGIFAAPRYASSLLSGRLPALSATSELRPFDSSRFEAAFDAAAGSPRLVILLSPT